MKPSQGPCQCNNGDFIDEFAIVAAQMLLGAGQCAQILRRFDESSLHQVLADAADGLDSKEFQKI